MHIRDLYTHAALSSMTHNERVVALEEELASYLCAHATGTLHEDAAKSEATAAVGVPRCRLLGIDAYTRADSQGISHGNSTHLSHEAVVEMAVLSKDAERLVRQSSVNGNAVCMTPQQLTHPAHQPLNADLEQHVVEQHNLAVDVSDVHQKRTGQPSEDGGMAKMLATGSPSNIRISSKEGRACLQGQRKSAGKVAQIGAQTDVECAKGMDARSDREFGETAQLKMMTRGPGKRKSRGAVQEAKAAEEVVSLRERKRRKCKAEGVGAFEVDKRLHQSPAKSGRLVATHEERVSSEPQVVGKGLTAVDAGSPLFDGALLSRGHRAVAVATGHFLAERCTNEVAERKAAVNGAPLPLALPPSWCVGDVGGNRAGDLQWPKAARATSASSAAVGEATDGHACAAEVHKRQDGGGLCAPAAAGHATAPCGPEGQLRQDDPIGRGITTIAAGQTALDSTGAVTQHQESVQGLAIAQAVSRGVVCEAEPVAESTLKVSGDGLMIGSGAWATQVAPVGVPTMKEPCSPSQDATALCRPDQLQVESEAGARSEPDPLHLRIAAPDPNAAPLTQDGLHSGPSPTQTNSSAALDPDTAAAPTTLPDECAERVALHPIASREATAVAKPKVFETITIQGPVQAIACDSDLAAACGKRSGSPTPDPVEEATCDRQRFLEQERKGCRRKSRALGSRSAAQDSQHADVREKDASAAAKQAQQPEPGREEALAAGTDKWQNELNVKRTSAAATVTQPGEVRQKGASGAATVTQPGEVRQKGASGAATVPQPGEVRQKGASGAAKQAQQAELWRETVSAAATDVQKAQLGWDRPSSAAAQQAELPRQGASAAVADAREAKVSWEGTLAAVSGEHATQEAPAAARKGCAQERSAMGASRATADACEAKNTTVSGSAMLRVLRPVEHSTVRDPGAHDVIELRGHRASSFTPSTGGTNASTEETSLGNVPLRTTITASPSLSSAAASARNCIVSLVSAIAAASAVPASVPGAVRHLRTLAIILCGVDATPFPPVATSTALTSHAAPSPESLSVQGLAGKQPSPSPHLTPPVATRCGAPQAMPLSKPLALLTSSRHGTPSAAELCVLVLYPLLHLLEQGAGDVLVALLDAQAMCPGCPTSARALLAALASVQQWPEAQAHLTTVVTKILQVHEEFVRANVGAGKDGRLSALKIEACMSFAAAWEHVRSTFAPEMLCGLQTVRPVIVGALKFSNTPDSKDCQAHEHRMVSHVI
jgi:hypothetical protein